MTVLDLLDEIDDIVEKAPSVPLTGKIVIDGEELSNIVLDIRKSLPDDVHQAQWVKDEKERILKEAKSEYERIILEAQKQADYLVESHDITLRAQKLGVDIQNDALGYARELKMRTYDYVDKLLFNMEKSLEDVSSKLFVDMYAQLEKSFNDIDDILKHNREEIKDMAYRTQNEMDNADLSDTN